MNRFTASLEVLKLCTNPVNNVFEGTVQEKVHAYRELSRSIQDRINQLEAAYLNLGCDACRETDSDFPECLPECTERIIDLLKTALSNDSSFSSMSSSDRLEEAFKYLEEIYKTSS